MNWQRLYEMTLLIQRLKCFFVGHNERMGNPLNYEEDYCNRCFVHYPQDLITMPDMLNKVYIWLVEQDSILFNHLDNWLLEKHRKRLPSWWEY